METKTYPKSAAAWIKKTKKGDDYLSVKLADGTWINLFKNNHKQNDKHPDFKEIVKQEPDLTGYEFNSKVDGPTSNNEEDIPF